MQSLSLNTAYEKYSYLPLHPSQPPQGGASSLFFNCGKLSPIGLRGADRHYSMLIIVLLFTSTFLFAQDIPLAEHPRPDFERIAWKNLNGTWQFEFDSLDVGIKSKWPAGATKFSKQITVPFPWGSELSGLEDEADIGWYHREITIEPTWKSKRTFLTIGASDWETTVWLDGQLLGTHQGGYVPFSFELTNFAKYGQAQKLVIRADDKRRDFTLYGKQGYGNARGIWQTVYLEARGKDYLDAVHFTPDIDEKKVGITAYLGEVADRDLNLSLTIKTEGPQLTVKAVFPKGKQKMDIEIPIPNLHLWTLDDPYLYDVKIQLEDDQVNSYLGMRKISVVNLPGTEHPYVALNDQPVYLQLTLDQSYHPEGFYTFPSDQFMKEEIERTKAIGLNGIRPHIKVEIPRKLYWADKLGLLVMADLPNSWGDPDEKMQAEAEYAFRQMVKRDYNHPSIFSWVLFNETWGLRTHTEENGKRVGKYLPKTQMWVASMYYLAKSLDQTRLVEDNSICCGAGHTETDINSFHDYLPGWAWEERLKDLTESSFEGSEYQFEKGFKQGRSPKINSECGNVWGYDGSTGDVDWSWDYHRMINTFRKYPEVAGWLYTEHHDVINEWNGYWRFDRSEKFTGLEDIVKGMSLRDFHAPVYLSTGNEICQTVIGGEDVEVPLYLSSMSSQDFGSQLKIRYELSLNNAIGNNSEEKTGNRVVDYLPFAQKTLEPLRLTLPDQSGVAILKLYLEDMKGNILHHNFYYFEINSERQLPDTEILSVAPKDFSDQSWSVKQWDVLDGLKVNGAGKGFFEYTIPLSKSRSVGSVKEAYVLLELSAKALFVKDQEGAKHQNVDFMLGGLVAPSSNPNSYPMTDETKFPSSVTIIINGRAVMTTILPDDPADHRGVLSWHHQLKDRKLREAGSYGYLTKIPISKKTLRAASKTGQLVIRVQANDEGGVAVYGKSFGRYAVDPGLVLRY